MVAPDTSNGCGCVHQDHFPSTGEVQTPQGDLWESECVCLCVFGCVFAMLSVYLLFVCLGRVFAMLSVHKNYLPWLFVFAVLFTWLASCNICVYGCFRFIFVTNYIAILMYIGALDLYLLPIYIAILL